MRFFPEDRHAKEVLIPRAEFFCRRTRVKINVLFDAEFISAF